MNKAYSKTQIKFIFDLVNAGIIYREVARRYNKKFNDSITANAVNKIVGRHKKDFRLTRKTIKEVIVDKYLELLKKYKRLPHFSDLIANGISRRQIEFTFRGIDALHKYIVNNHPKSVKGLVNEHLYDHKQFKKLSQDLQKYNKFVVTTAVTESNIHDGFYKSIKNYCKANKAKLIIIPAQGIYNKQGNSSVKWNLDGNLHDEFIVFNDVKLNDHLFISSIQVNAKQVNPLSGLSRIGQKNGSFIMSGTKQLLSFVDNSNSKSIPRALMTTGAITVADYENKHFMSKRTNYIAENDHKFGAIIVELDKKNIFHFRQIQANPKTGEFADLGKKYTPSKISKLQPEALILGDYHCGSIDSSVKESLKDITRFINPKNIILHDFYDGKSISHHDMGKPGVKAKKALEGKLSLKAEIQDCAKEVDFLAKLVKGQLVFVKSNHDEVLEKYLIEGRYVFDPNNHYYSLDLAKAMLDDKDPLQYAIEEVEGTKSKDKCIWLQRDESYKIGGVECGAHGDKGANGSRGTMSSIEQAYGSAVVGHSHTAAILRDIFRVGTSSLLRLDYNSGPSTWTHTHCIIYKDGTRQLINIVDGKWKL